MTTSTERAWSTRCGWPAGMDPTAFIGQLRDEMRDALSALDIELPKQIRSSCW